MYKNKFRMEILSNKIVKDEILMLWNILHIPNGITHNGITYILPDLLNESKTLALQF